MDKQQKHEANGEIQMSELNPNYPKMMEEFIYKDVLWVYWSTQEKIQRIENDFNFFDDDIIIATYPKSGTTLMQEIVWLILNNVDVEKAKSTRVFERVPFLEENWVSKFPEEMEECFPIDYLPKMPRPRLIKTHLPYHIIGPRLENQKIKTIYVVRNPKDTMVSYYHFYKGVVDYGPWPWSFREFYKMWMDRWMVAGDWFKTIKDWWAEKDRDHILFVKYEDLVKRPFREVQRVAEFLDKKLNDSEIQKIVDATTFETMKSNHATNYSSVPGMLDNFVFMRKGQIGDWKRFFLVCENEKFDKVYEKEFGDTGLTLEFE